jgi:hypothetical protein
MKRTANKTTKKEILEYHYENTDECGMGADASEWNTHCWRCGHERNTQKCHVIPYALGGEDIASNYVLLCEDCHSEAPNVNDKEFMMKWIKRTSISSYNCYWDIRDIISNRMLEVSKHFGATRENILTTSTQQWLEEKMVEDMKKRFGSDNYRFTKKWLETILTER